MSITTHRRAVGDTSTKARLPMLAPPLAALLYPFALKGFNASVTRIPEADAFALPWLTAALCLTLAFAMPLIAMLAAMSLSGIGRPTVAQLRAKRAALLAVAAPTLFTFVGVVLYMLHDPGARHVALGRVLGPKRLSRPANCTMFVSIAEGRCSGQLRNAAAPPPAKGKTNNRARRADSALQVLNHNFARSV